VRALATQARASAWLLAVAPIGFAALMSTVEPRAVGFLVATPIGWACLATGIALDVVGAVWMARVVGATT
jgi:tight adherence protein B